MNESAENTNFSQPLKTLSEQRERLGLTHRDVADQLKISETTIVWLEQGEFEKIGAPTYVRGYISNYAKAVGLDPREVLQDVSIQHTSDARLSLPESMLPSPMMRVRSGSSHLGKYALGTVLLGTLGVSLWFVVDKLKSPMPMEPAGIARAENSLGVDDESPEQRITFSSLIPQAGALDAGKDNVSAEGGPMVLPAVEDQGEDNVINAVDLDATAIEPLDADAQSLSQDATASVQGLYQLNYELSEPAWVEVHTVDGERLVYDLKPAGSHRVASDKAVHIRIGNADKASLTINGETINVQSHSRNNVADFNWPEDA